jgi:hypothetical protein
LKVLAFYLTTKNISDLKVYKQSEGLFALFNSGISGTNAIKNMYRYPPANQLEDVKATLFYINRYTNFIAGCILRIIMAQM